MAEPATTGLAGEAGAGCLAGLTGLSGEIFNGYKMISKIKDQRCFECFGDNVQTSKTEGLHIQLVCY